MSIDKDFFNQFLTQEIDNIDTDDFDDFAYQGFDPLVIKGELIKKQWQKKELVQLLMFYLTRGTNTGSKAMGRSTEVCQRLISSLRSKGLVAKPVSTKCITVNRIVSALPDIVAGILARHGSKCRILCADVSPELPIFLKFSAGASLCKDEEQLNLWKTWATEMDKVINNKPDASRVKMFADIQFRSQAFSIQKREQAQKAIEKL